MLRICLIDDDAMVLGAMALALEDCGYAVSRAADGAAALAAMAGEAPDVVMTDMTMPGLAGPALIKQIRERFPDLPIVAMSGDEQANVTDGAADVFLHKPFKLRDARAAIEAALRKRGLVV